MTFETYQAYIQTILNSKEHNAPYDDPDYLNYTKLNWSRTQRWLKTGKLNAEISKSIQQIAHAQKWIVITEPWCGDAAHIVPFLEMMARLNDNITIEYELRDEEPHRINDYLTNGKSKSIPILIIQDNARKDLAVWGPRPKACQIVHDELLAKNADLETMKTALQLWYNKDEGKEIMSEISALLKGIIK